MKAIELMACDRVRAAKATVFPLAEADHVHKLLHSGSALGKRVLHP